MSQIELLSIAIADNLRKVGILLLPLALLRASVSISTLASKSSSARTRYGIMSAKVREDETEYLDTPVRIRITMLE